MPAGAKPGEVIQDDRGRIVGRKMKNVTPGRGDHQTVEDGVALIKPRSLSADELADGFRAERKQYAAMHAHMEIAATWLAAGSTKRRAAREAGISVRQVKKYYMDPDFRKRIEELRAVMMSRMRGQLLKEIARRVSSKKVKSMSIVDLMRVYDRIAGTMSGRTGVTIAGDINVTNYDTLIQSLLTHESGEKGADFPIFELGGPAVPSEDSPV